MKYYLFTIALLIAVALNAPLPVSAEAAPNTTAGVDYSTYQLGPEDALSITVANFPELSAKPVVSPDGKISVPLLDPVLVAGKSVTEVANVLTQQWSQFVIRPAVTVALEKQRVQSVMIFGFAARSGPLDYHRGMRLLEAIASVGGPAANGELKQVTITHKDGRKQVLDLSHPDTKAGSPVDILLTPGDVVYIPERRSQFSVLGEVAHPGSFDYRDDMSVIDALTAVGGVNPNADLQRATLFHGGIERNLDLKALLQGGDLRLNTRLAAGDVISVPERRSQFSVLGEVAKPGSYSYRDDMSVLDAITSVGGVNETADLQAATFIHGGKETKLNLKALLQNHDLSLNAKLGPGDVISIPSRAIQFGVLGQVNAPGRFPYRDDMTLIDALTLVGGVKDSADLDGATLIHNGQETKLDLRSLLKQGNLALNIKLSPGDVISVPQSRTQFSVLGEVGKPGSYDFRDDMTVLDALTAVGGVKDSADLDAPTLTHNGQASKLDLRALLQTGDLSHNIKLAPGDVISVPLRSTQFSVLGEVNQPGSFAYQDNITVLEALKSAGGLKETADFTGTMLEHDGKEIPLDMDGLLRHGDLSKNVKLAPGDRIMVGEIRDRNYVFGAVQKPGYYAFKPGDRVLDAVTAGGPLHDADLSQAKVIHVDRTKNVATVNKVNISKIFEGDMKGNIPLQAGDVVFVPDKKHGFGIGDIFSALTGLNIVGSTVRILTGGL